MGARLAAISVLIALALTGCRAAPQPRPEPPPRAAAPAPAPPLPAMEVPDLEGGPEDGERRHTDPPAPPEGAYLSGDKKYRLVALTFDDGPDESFTTQVLDVLKQHNAKATFYLVGRRAAALPNLVRRMVAEGHEVGNHTQSHARLTKLNPDRVNTEMREADRILREISGQAIQTFRPPYGDTNEIVQRVAEDLGYLTVLWNIDSLDWKKGTGRNDVLQNVLPNVSPGAIILQHSAGGKGEDLTNTVQALPEIIRRLREEGYQIVTVSQMLATGQPVAGQW